MNEETTDKKLGGCTGRGWLPGQSGNPSGRPSRKPLTEAILARLSAEDQAEIIATHARKGKQWAIELAASYTQAKETLSRMAGEREGEPIRIDSGWRDGLTQAEIADLERMAAAYNADAGAAVEAAMSIVNAKSEGGVGEPGSREGAGE